MAEQRRAAFFRVEGCLVKPPRLPAAAWLTLNGAEVSQRFTRLSSVAVAGGLKLMGTFHDQHLLQRATWMGLRGMSDDRLAVLGEEYFDAYLRPNLLDVGRELIEQAKRQGFMVVLLSDNISPVMGNLLAHVPADVLLCNHLELRNGRATGRLSEPVIGGAISGTWTRSWASEQDVDLGASRAYGTRHSDSMLLNLIGQPCVVNPDSGLRRLASDLDWPVVER